MKWIHLSIFLVFIGILSHRCQRCFPTVDEIAHLPAGVSHCKFGRFDLYNVNPPLVRVVAVGLGGFQDRFDWSLYRDAVGKRPEFAIGINYLEHNGLSIAGDFVRPRWVALSFWILGVALMYAITRSVAGNWAAFLACVLWMASPNILAHAPTILPDVGAVSCGMLACLSAWKYLQCPDFGSAFLAGAAMGLALLSKLTWITALVSLPAAATFCFWALRGWLPGRKWRRRLVDLLTFWGVSLYVLNTGYAFEGSFTPLGKYEFCSQKLSGEDSAPRVHGNRFENCWLASVPVPLPRNYVLGIDYLKMEVEQKRWSFLLGEWRHGSWPHYYVLTTLMKTPEPTLIAAALGVVVFVLAVWRKLASPELISMVALLTIPAAVCFASVSLQGGFNHHHRYVLMIYPPMFLFASLLASPLARRVFSRRRSIEDDREEKTSWHWNSVLAVVLVTLSVASSLRVHPHYTSYFNTLSGGPENGWRLLGFSNIDWGQDLLEVDEWIKQHPDCRPLVFNLDYFGTNGELFGLPPAKPPELPKGASIDEVRTDETQWWIISVKKLYNYPDHTGLEYLQQLEPVDRIAYAYHVYRIDPKSE